MIVLGVVLLVIWLLTKVAILLFLGIAFAVIGLVLYFVGPIGANGTRRRYY